MRVLHVIPSLSILHGGPSFALSMMAKGLTQAGVIVHIATTDDNNQGRPNVSSAQHVDRNGVKIWYFRRQTRFYTFSWPLTYWLARHIRDYDLVHIHALFSFPTLPAALFSAYHHVPYIVRPLGTLNRWGMKNRRPMLKQLSFKLVESHVLAHAALIHFTSESERVEALETSGDAASLVLPLGVDLAPFDTLPTPEHFLQRYPQLRDRTIILFLSRLDPVKGLDLLLPAFAVVHQAHPEATLVVAGDGEVGFVTSLKDQALRLGISDLVIWTGFLSGQDKLSALSAADIFVLPSYSENFGVAVVEALAAGIPSIISNRVGIATEIAINSAGLIVSCDVESISSALARLISDTGLAKEVSINARTLAQARYSVGGMASSLIDMYRSAIDKTGSSQPESKRLI